MRPVVVLQVTPSAAAADGISWMKTRLLAVNAVCATCSVACPAGTATTPVAADPQLIVLGDAAYGTCPADVAARSGWSSISAVADGRIVPVDDTIVTRPGPRLADGLAALALAIHPDAQIVPPSDAQAFCTTQPRATP